MLRQPSQSRKLLRFPVIQLSSFHVSRRAAGSTGHAATSASAERFRCHDNNDKVALLFCECFKGMEELLVRRPGHPVQRPMTSPLFTTPAGVMSSSSLSSSGNGRHVHSVKTARSFFPNRDDLFPDLTVSGMCREKISFSPSSGTSELKKVASESDGNKGNNNKHMQARSPTLGRPVASSVDQQTTSETSAAPTAAAYADAQSYVYAYGLWQSRNAALLQMVADMQELANKARYLRDVQGEGIQEGMRQTTRFTFYVVFPFVLLVSIFFFNDSALYSSQLHHLRLVDYDAWLANRKNRGRGGALLAVLVVVPFLTDPSRGGEKLQERKD
ncbi:hypothetical protein TraAM80_03177 [Trypanosoma rangeli]|uniref:Uncharacterized protein n=1 Tax=Trypanosoma rangeli TaxID=5698 RepID=A0A422NQE8_TRYRA|nr:uncharacterized protein TraAM80_03177 [Trypanosoma rangeli]RNF07730.1 hypothetical protein TraAM80_03177 [Trypanosoma rangeli]|eukprot:RNF07730.1 hypothetical protein TraAM80_03177 [Trypanosoma rangeli]